MENDCKAANDSSESFWQNVERFNDKFEFVKKLGQGSFSTVVLARLKSKPSIEFAVKCLIQTTHPRRAVTEFQILRDLGGRNNVINLLSSYRKNDRIFIIMDFFPHDHFPTFVSNATMDEIRDYIKNLLIALDHIHRFDIIHRDVKATNFLFNRTHRRYRLIDFGLAEVAKSERSPCTTSETLKLKRKFENQENQTGAPLAKKRIVNVPKQLGSVTNLSVNKQNSDGRRSAKRTLFNENKTEEKLKCKITMKTKSPRRSICACFGKSCVCKVCNGRKSQKANKAGTAGFRAPEILLNHPQQTTAIDVWSAGIIFLGLLSRRYPFMRPKDDGTALAQLVTLFGTTKIAALNAQLGKKLLCKPLRPLLSLKLLCEIFRCDKSQLKKLTLNEPCKICCRSVHVSDCYICFCRTKSVRTEITTVLPDTPFNLLDNLLDVDPSARLTANASLNHDFFSYFT